MSPVTQTSHSSCSHPLRQTSICNCAIKRALSSHVNAGKAAHRRSNTNCSPGAITRSSLSEMQPPATSRSCASRARSPPRRCPFPRTQSRRVKVSTSTCRSPPRPQALSPSRSNALIPYWAGSFTNKFRPLSAKERQASHSFRPRWDAGEPRQLTPAQSCSAPAPLVSPICWSPESRLETRSPMAIERSSFLSMGHFVRVMRARGRLLSVKPAAMGAIAVVAVTGSAVAFQTLPPGAQVNNDPSAGIDGTLNVNGEEPANADVVGGALTAGTVAVPWAIFRQQTAAGGRDQTFVRSFAEGEWSTRGSGTVGGGRGARPVFGGSLNFAHHPDGEAPAIDFAGAGRTVPWASWYESTTGAGFANNNVFASRFDNVGDANQGRWIFSGQNRGTGGGSMPVPSLNIHTDESAEDPSVAGGSTVDDTTPSPWVAWQETSTASVGSDQIFVERSEGPGLAPAG